MGKKREINGNRIKNDSEKVCCGQDGRMVSIYIVHAAMFIFALGFSINLTGVYPYMKQLLPGEKDETIIVKYGWIVAANPLGQMLASPILGWAANKMGSIRIIILLTTLSYIAGNVIYSTLSLFPSEDTRYALLLASRFIVGASSGNSAPLRAYVSIATFTEERTMHLSLISLFQSLGFILGPGIQAVLTPIQCADHAGLDSYLSFDMYTLAGWLSAIVGVGCFILFLPCIFHEYDVTKEEVNAMSEDPNEIIKLPKPDYFALFISLLNFFVFLFNFVLLET